ncbi:invasion associated locus B family protein [Agrobacterium burrii]|uniref:Invasion associated locus B family protein n=1 Tax=Agrobacterium burrii TaxID=2815339 RepID=A0ABS3EI11_9HYPH|nr:invasion associated locus B family protein [Agrobacterium burrii]MBO0131601.1 invasion associated locus B family protein [Agrobacterium burrii]
MNSQLPALSFQTSFTCVHHHKGLTTGLRVPSFFARIAFTLVMAGTISFATVPSWAQEPTTKGQTDIRAPSDVRVEHFDDWTLRCVAPPATNGKPATSPACEIAQQLMVSQNGKPLEVLNLAVSRANDKAGKADWALVVLTPLDVHLASDFGFAAGTAKPSLLKYRNCNHLGCFVIVPLDRDRLAQMKKAADGTAYFRLLNSQTVKASFSLKGFTKAFDALASGAVPSTQAVNDDKTAPSKAVDGGN